MADTPQRKQSLSETHKPALERPMNLGARQARFGSDVVADTLRSLDIPYIALNPGASFRGLRQPRQSPRQRAPRVLLCLHEARGGVAHGWARLRAGRWRRRCIPTSV
jgi:hypothetical protein